MTTWTLNVIPARERRRLPHILSFSIQNVPHHRRVDAKLPPALRDSYAGIVVDVAVTRNALEQTPAFVAMDGTSGKPRRQRGERLPVEFEQPLGRQVRV